MTDTVVKSEFKQVSNYVGAAVIMIGNVLPYLTPATLVALGLPAGQIQIASTIIGLLCVAYREKQPASVSVNVAPPIPANPPGDSPK